MFGTLEALSQRSQVPNNYPRKSQQPQPFILAFLREVCNRKPFDLQERHLSTISLDILIFSHSIWQIYDSAPYAATGERLSRSPLSWISFLSVFDRGGDGFRIETFLSLGKFCEACDWDGFRIFGKVFELFFLLESFEKLGRLFSNFLMSFIDICLCDANIRFTGVRTGHLSRCHRQQSQRFMLLRHSCFRFSYR